MTEIASYGSQELINSFQVLKGECMLKRKAHKTRGVAKKKKVCDGAGVGGTSGLLEKIKDIFLKILNLFCQSFWDFTVAHSRQKFRRSHLFLPHLKLSKFLNEVYITI